MLVDNLTIKFSSKSALEKIIEYINFETSNKYTVIFSQFSNNNSRPNTRGTNLSVASKPGSPIVRKLSGTKAYNKNSCNKNTSFLNKYENKSARSSTAAYYIHDLNDEYENDDDISRNLMNSNIFDNEEMEKVNIL